ncbi:MAG: hypothetical protein WD775_04405 [Burkholderiales bacterium]
MISTAGALRRHRYALAAKIAAQRLRHSTLDLVSPDQFEKLNQA